MNLTNNFDKLNKIAHDESNKKGEDCIQTHEKSGYARKLTFVLQDGSRKFFNYSHLMDGEFNPEENTIILKYTTGTVNMRGHSLHLLFDLLELDCIRKIYCLDKRYTDLISIDEIAVFDVNFLII